MTKLKGIYKDKSSPWTDYYHFAEWVKRTNNIDVVPGEEYRVQVATKRGRRRRLKSMVAVLDVEYPACSCCDVRMEVRFTQPMPAVLHPVKV